MKHLNGDCTISRGYDARQTCRVELLCRGGLDGNEYYVCDTRVCFVLKYICMGRFFLPADDGRG